MALQSTVQVSGSIGGLTMTGNFTRSGSHAEPYEITLAAGKSGTLSTRTDNDTGVITSSSHGITDSDTVDVYWSGGSRHGMTVTSYDANTVTADGGAGDNLPAQSTAVVICKQQAIADVAFDGTALQLFMVSCDQRAILQVFASGPSLLGTFEIDAAGESYLWSGGTTPLNGTAATAKASNGSTTAATLRFGGLLA